MKLDGAEVELEFNVVDEELTNVIDAVEEEEDETDEGVVTGGG